MKKSLVFILSLFLVLGNVFAQDSSVEETGKANLSMKVIVPENQHTTDKFAKVRIEYIPISDEVRIYYTSMYVTYQPGEAMNTVMACLKDFQKDNQYYSYKYMERDKERYFKDERGVSWTQYMSHVKFSR